MKTKHLHFRQLSQILWRIREDSFMPMSKMAKVINDVVPGVKVTEARWPDLRRLLVLVKSVDHLSATKATIEAEGMRVINPMFIRVTEDLKRQSRELMKLEASLWRYYKYE